ncbi:hypothetical protein [Butyrivibrio sp. AE2005]|uniref:hypothetical protein n=1 Tax=Butyrivibrio sp. AE2005 TaxID=1496722 RepID=UPI00047DD7D4|nr:hypothetical protein [Butyrivibrio sp. AE2005]
MAVILIYIAIVLFTKYKRKKDDEIICEAEPIIVDNVLPYKRGLPEIQNENELALFEQFVRERWPKNYERYELIGSSLSANFLAPHRIIVHHTDGTFHEEVIRVSAVNKAMEDDEYGKVYKFTVWGEKDSHKTSRQEDKPITSKIIPAEKQESREISQKEIAQNWLSENLSWIKEELSSGYLFLRYGIKERECPPELKEEMFNAINDLNLFQLQYEDGGIGIYPEADI